MSFGVEVGVVVRIELCIQDVGSTRVRVNLPIAGGYRPLDADVGEERTGGKGTGDEGFWRGSYPQGTVITSEHAGSCAGMGENHQAWKT
jgi:hypothetical protein